MYETRMFEYNFVVIASRAKSRLKFNHLENHEHG